MIIRSLLAALVFLVMSAPAWAFPKAEVLWTPYLNAAHCRPDEDSLMVLVRDNDEVIARDDYCSAYNAGHALVVEDGHKRLYVAIEFSVGRNSFGEPNINATKSFLKIMYVDRATGTLRELAHVLLGGTWFNNYFIVDTKDGLDVHLTFDQGRNSDCCEPPAKQITIHVGP